MHKIGQNEDGESVMATLDGRSRKKKNRINTIPPENRHSVYEKAIHKQ